MKLRTDNRFSTDDQAVFERFYLDNVRLFTNFGFGIIPETETVRDIVQEAFIGLWDRREILQSVDHTKAFLYTSIHNRLLNVLRNRKVATRHAEKMRGQHNEDSFRDLIIETEMYEFLCRKIESLPPMQQKVIWLHSEGLTNEQIAQKLEISVNTVLTHKQRAKSALKGYFDTFTCTAVLSLLDFFSSRV